MSYFKDFLPQELKLVIVSYIQPNKINVGELDSCIATIENLKTYDETLIDVSHLNSLIRIKQLYKKYIAYNDTYECGPNLFLSGIIYEPPQLLDALFAGCRLLYAKSSVRHYDETVEKDINDIVKLIPNAIHCNLGILRCRDLVTPLCAACINDNIPLTIVKLLIDNGADTKQQIRVNCSHIELLKDLQANISCSRYSAIKTIFTEKENSRQ
jgi:hypothetical protein